MAARSIALGHRRYCEGCLCQTMTLVVFSGWNSRLLGRRPRQNATSHAAASDQFTRKDEITDVAAAAHTPRLGIPHSFRNIVTLMVHGDVRRPGFLPCMAVKPDSLRYPDFLLTRPLHHGI